jgi:hypothetical protein
MLGKTEARPQLDEDQPALDPRIETAKMAAQTQPHITTDHPPQAAPPAAAPQYRLQEVLPAIMQLAQRVGGLKHLEEIVRDLQAGKEE